MEGAVGVACCCACRGDGAGCISAFVVGQEAGKGIGQARATELSTPSTVDHRQFCSSVCPSGRIAATMGSGTNAHGSMATSLTYPRCPTRVEAMCPDHPTCARRAIWLRLLQSCFMWKVLGRIRQGAGAHGQNGPIPSSPAPAVAPKRKLQRGSAVSDPDRRAPPKDLTTPATRQHWKHPSTKARRTTVGGPEWPD